MSCVKPVVWAIVAASMPSDFILRAISSTFLLCFLHFNGKLFAVGCRAGNVEKSVPVTDEHFEDTLHLSPKGNAVLAETVADGLKKGKIIPEAVR
ncbi:MAG: hypothetical protein LBT89_03380 [Planctomycetaceae bacterium]|nr:hypothetical protein [Planctomycetaceae bacterium]